jgi:hypothetical protein
MLSIVLTGEYHPRQWADQGQYIMDIEASGRLGLDFDVLTCAGAHVKCPQPATVLRTALERPPNTEKTGGLVSVKVSAFRGLDHSLRRAGR